MIKRIELINFMSHEHTVIEPAAGLTVLVGPNNCGKSAIVTALQILCHNDNSTYVLRHGAKECRIIVETDDGHVIEWSRKKSGSPCYKIDGEPFDRLNNKDSGVWEKLKRTLRLPRVEFDKNKFDVHIGEQRNPVFLLGDKGKGAAQFFASSSDAIRLVEMQDLHKRQNAENKREHGRLSSQKTQVAEALDCLELVPKVDDQLEQIEKQYAALRAKEVEAENLDRALSELKVRRKGALRIAATDVALRDLPQPPKFSDPIPLQVLVQKMQTEQDSVRQGESLRAALKLLTAPPEFSNPMPLQGLIEKIKVEEVSIRQSESIGNALKPLAAPPELGDPESLQQLIVKVSAEQVSIRRSDNLKTVLADLAEPPTVSSSDDLESRVHSIRRHQQIVARLIAVKDVLSKVKSPQTKEPESAPVLAKRIFELQTEIQACSDLDAKLKKAKQRVCEAEADIEQWVAYNPSCPTCGSEISPEVILGGGHQHG